MEEKQLTVSSEKKKTRCHDNKMTLYEDRRKDKKRTISKSIKMIVFYEYLSIYRSSYIEWHVRYSFHIFLLQRQIHYELKDGNMKATLRKNVIYPAIPRRLASMCCSSLKCDIVRSIIGWKLYYRTYVTAYSTIEHRTIQYNDAEMNEVQCSVV